MEANAFEDVNLEDGLDDDWREPMIVDNQTEGHRLALHDEKSQSESQVIRDDEEEDMAELDEDLSPANVLDRIETVIARFVEDSATGTAPTLHVISRSKRNAVYRHRPEKRVQGDDSAVRSRSESMGDPAPQMTLGLRDRTQTRDLVTKEAAGAFTIARGKYHQEVDRPCLLHQDQLSNVNSFVI